MCFTGRYSTEEVAASPGSRDLVCVCACVCMCVCAANVPELLSVLWLHELHGVCRADPALTVVVAPQVAVVCVHEATLGLRVRVPAR